MKKFLTDNITVKLLQLINKCRESRPSTLLRIHANNHIGRAHCKVCRPPINSACCHHAPLPSPLSPFLTAQWSGSLPLSLSFWPMGAQGTVASGRGFLLRKSAGRAKAEKGEKRGTSSRRGRTCTQLRFVGPFNHLFLPIETSLGAVNNDNGQHRPKFLDIDLVKPRRRQQRRRRLQQRHRRRQRRLRHSSRRHSERSPRPWPPEPSARPPTSPPSPTPPAPSPGTVGLGGGGQSRALGLRVGGHYRYVHATNCKSRQTCSSDNGSLHSLQVATAINSTYIKRSFQ